MTSSFTILRQMGVNPHTILDELTEDERQLLEGEARRLNCSPVDLIAMRAIHGLSPLDLRAAALASEEKLWAS